MTLCERESGGNLLCIRLSALGDVVHCMNALTLLRRNRPAAHITWIVENSAAGLLENHPYIDDLIPIPRVDWGSAIKDPWRWAEVVPEVTELAAGLRRAKFDVSIDFQSSLKSSWLVAAAGAPVRVGFAPPISRELNHLFQNRLVTVPARDCHRVQRNLALLSPFGISGEYSPAVLPCATEHKEVAENIWDALKRPLIVIHPGASQFAKFKRWIPECYGELACRLVRELDAAVLVSFGPGEEALARRVVVSSRHEARLVPRLSHLQQLTGLLNKADLFIGGDTGPMHLASALGTPVVALFGPKDPLGTGPFDCPSEVVTAGVPCSPCTKRECPDPLCMSAITTGQVFRAARRLLSGKPGPTVNVSLSSEKPFFCDFRIGNWSGKAHVSLSRAEFYRSLSMSVVQGESDKANLMSETSKSENYNFSFSGAEFERPGGGVLSRVKSDCFGRKGGWWYLARGKGLKRYWKSAVKIYNQNLYCILPICWMVCSDFSNHEEVMLFEVTPEADVWFFSKINSPHEPRMLEKLGGTIRNFHQKGFHYRHIYTHDIAISEQQKLVMRNLEKVRALRLPPFIREIYQGRELRPLYKELKGVCSPDNFIRYFLLNYCRGYLKDIVSKRLLARNIHPELDIPELLSR